MSGAFQSTAFQNSAFQTGSTPTPTPTPTPSPSGGYFGGTARAHRSAEEIRRARERFGIVEQAAQVITAVALRQANSLEQDEHKRFEELERELALRGLAWEARYLEMLNEQRERLIGIELKERMQEAQRIEEEISMALLVTVLF